MKKFWLGIFQVLRGWEFQFEGLGFMLEAHMDNSS